MSEHESQGQEPRMQSESQRMESFEARLAALEEHGQAQESQPVTQPSGDFTHSGIELAGRHIPEMHSEVLSAHERQTVELPGVYEIGAVIEGAFIPLARLKAAEVLEVIERAERAAAESDDARE